jgi:hypothetical protein
MSRKCRNIAAVCLVLLVSAVAVPQTSGPVSIVAFCFPGHQSHAILCTLALVSPRQTFSRTEALTEPECSLPALHLGKKKYATRLVLPM